MVVTNELKETMRVTAPVASNPLSVNVDFDLRLVRRGAGGRWGQWLRPRRSRIGWLCTTAPGKDYGWRATQALRRSAWV